MPKIAVLGVFLLTAVFAPAASAQDLERFFGAYVGSGTSVDAKSGETGARDLDVTIEPYKDDGFTISSITIVREDGSDRTDPNIRRRAVEESFLPSQDIENIYIVAPRGSLFEKAELPNPLRGEPMRWAAVDGDTLSLHSLGITETGRLEIQIFHRTLTETGMDVTFSRMQDEEVMVRVNGNLVRTE